MDITIDYFEEEIVIHVQHVGNNNEILYVHSNISLKELHFIVHIYG